MRIIKRIVIVLIIGLMTAVTIWGGIVRVIVWSSSPAAIMGSTRNLLTF